MRRNRAALGIVTLNWNQGRFLRDAVESVLAQSFQDWNLVIVDPGSTDGSRALYDMPFIADDHRITVLREPDHGPADGLNKGFARLTCPYGYYLNADDRVRPGAFAEAMEHLNEHPDVDIVMGHGLLIDEWGRTLRRVYSDVFDPWAFVTGRNVAIQQATFFRTQVLEMTGGFNVANRISWDGEFVFAAGMAGAGLRTVNRTWGEFRIYRGTITSDSASLQKLHREQARMRERFLASRPRPVISGVLLEVRRRAAHPVRTVNIAAEKAFNRFSV